MDRFDASHGGQQQQQYRQPPRGQQQQQPSPTTFNPPPGQVHPLPSLYHVLPGGQQQQQHPQQQQQQQQQLLAQQVVGGGGAIRSPLLHQQQQHYAAQQQQHRQQHQQHQQQHQQHQQQQHQQQQQQQQQQHAHQQQHQLQQQQYPAFSANPGPYGQQQYNGGHLGGQQQQHPTLHQQQHPASHLGYGSSNGLTFMNPSQPASSAAGSARSHSPFSDAGEDQPSAKRVKREGAGDVKTPGGGGGTGTGGGAKNSAGGGRSEAGGDDDDGDTKGGKGKKRAVQSCSECRRRKIRCDRKFPCSPCSQRGDEAICREVEKHSASSTGCASSSDLLAISHRLAALESVLKDNGTIRAGEVDARAGKKGKAPTGGKLDAHWKNGDIVAVLGTGTGEGGGGGASETGRGGQGSSGRGRMKGGLRGGGQEGGRGGGGSGQSQRETVSGNDDDDKDVSADGRSDGDGEIDGNGDGHNSVDSETEGAAITLEHLAFGRRKDEPGRGTARQRPQSPSLDSSPQNDLAGAGQGGSLSRRSSLSHSGLFSTSSYIPEGNSAVAGGSNASDNSGGAGGSATDGNGGAAGGTGSTSTSASGGRNEQQLALITRDSNNGSTSQAGIVDSPVDSSPAARKLSPLPPGATSFSLLNKKSIVAIGDQAPRGNYGGPFGMPHLPALGTFGRAPVPEGSIEDRKIQQRDFTDAKVVFDTFFRRSDIFMEAFISCMPGRPKERALVNHYFRKVEWFHHCIHVPTFLSECEEYWSIGHERAVAECSASWIGLFLLILCLSLHFMDDEEAARYGFTPEEQQTLPGTWFAGTRGALWQSDFLTNHSLECLQIIILSGVYLNNQDRADAHWGILGAGIKIAHMMGINRLGAEETDVKPGQRPRVWRGRWESVIAREVGRRCWWQLVFLDWSLAPSYGYACSIHPNQMDTAFPANIHDEDLIEGQPIRPLPMTTHTPMSYHLTRARMTQTSYQVTLMMNAPVQPPYEVIMAIDADYKKLQANFPSYYCVNEETPMMPPPANQSDPDMIKHMEKIMCNLSLQTRRLRLHRPYLNRGYTQPKYAASTRECVKAARAALALIYNGAGSSGIANFLEKWWITLFYTFISAIVILIDLLHSNRDDDWDKKLTEVKQSVDILRAIERVSSPARGTLKVLEALISEVQNRPGGNQETPDSNPLDLDSTTTLGLQRTVRKLVHENASHPPTHGPGSSGSSTSVEPPSPQILLPNTPGVFGNRGGEAGGGPDVGNVSNGSSDGSASQQLGSYLSAIGGGLQVGGPSSPLPLSPSIGAFWPDNAGAGDHPGIPSATGANGASGFSFSNDDIAGTGAGQHLFPMSLSGYGGSGGLGGSGMGYSSADGNTPALRSATQGLQGPGNLESDLMSQIFSLQELDWIHMGPNGGGAL